MCFLKLFHITSCIYEIYVYHMDIYYYYSAIFPCSASGAFVQALFIIVSRDVVKFVAMFLIVLIIFGGSFYMALTYTAVTTSGQHEKYAL